MPDRKVWFGYGLGVWNGADVSTAAKSVRLVVQADRAREVLGFEPRHSWRDHVSADAG